jgi:hypothetical protein
MVGKICSRERFQFRLGQSSPTDWRSTPKSCGLGGRIVPRISRQPSYRLHKARNCAVVTIDGKNQYLGPYKSIDSHEAYAASSLKRRSW